MAAPRWLARVLLHDLCSTAAVYDGRFRLVSPKQLHKLLLCFQTQFIKRLCSCF
jgi:hypothetical protein